MGEEFIAVYGEEVEVEEEAVSGRCYALSMAGHR